MIMNTVEKLEKSNIQPAHVDSYHFNFDHCFYSIESIRCATLRTEMPIARYELHPKNCFESMYSLLMAYSKIWKTSFPAFGSTWTSSPASFLLGWLTGAYCF